MKSFLNWRNAGFVVLVICGVSFIGYFENKIVEVSSGESEQLACSSTEVFETIFDTDHRVNKDMIDQLVRNDGNVYRAHDYMTSARYADLKREAVTQEMNFRIKLGQCTIVPTNTVVQMTSRDWDNMKSVAKSKSQKYVRVPLPGMDGSSYYVSPLAWRRADAEKANAQAQVEVKEAMPNAPPAVDASTQTRMDVRPIRNFAQGQPYAQVRETLLRDGWQPVISKDADECMKDDSRCQGRPEMQSCSGTGLAMCRFEWQRGERRLSICTAGEEQAKFDNVCDYR